MNFNSWGKAVRLCSLVALVTASAWASAQEITYDYTGIVTSAENIASGTLVTGTYTFDLAAAMTAQSSGNLQSNSYHAVAEGGPALPFGFQPPAPPPSAYVFASTAQIGALSFSTTAAPCATYCVSSVQASGGSLSAARFDYAGGMELGAWFDKVGSAISGYIQPAEFTRISFDITSLTPVDHMFAPEIDPASGASGITLLIVALVVLQTRRRPA